ncbi:hypothetical protein WICPIJ_006182 [Wickerhamomyces pijperi]|uniref:Required for respiratory growth protein 7, mitochondrial n=1 Tax=Wickerhamomyces pijperi TaxID=599730 RepID=A0A9P8Q255_WICPI|nr:hypothetical protein WICPIJ_006182 [Wickerhamomyces pijperi]
MQRLPRLLFLQIRSKSTKSITPQFIGLASYFKYAESTNLRTDTTTFVGTSYELLVQRQLTSILQMKKLEHMGGSFDYGIDLKGKWDLSPYKPTSQEQEVLPIPVFKGKKIKPIISKKSQIIDVLIQCKNHSVKLTAKHIREISGIYNFSVTSVKRSKTFMIVCSPTILTPQGITQMNAVDIPIIYIWLEKLRKKSIDSKEYDIEGYEGGQLKGFYCNDFATCLLQGLNVEADIQLLCE